MHIEVTPRFKKNYKRLSQSIRAKAKKKEIIFRKNPFDPCLETHKLHGRPRDVWAFSVDRSYRIVLVFIDKNTVLCLDIGTHDIYK